MIVKLFTVYDSKVKTWFTPLPFKHAGDALRWFQESANEKKSNLGKYPADFTLFELGEFDDQTAVVTTHKTPIAMGVAIEFVNNLVPSPSVIGNPDTSLRATG